MIAKLFAVVLQYVYVELSSATSPCWSREVRGRRRSRERHFNILIVVAHIEFPLFACVSLACRLPLSVGLFLVEEKIDQNRLARPQRPPQAAEQGLAVVA